MVVRFLNPIIGAAALLMAAPVFAADSPLKLTFGGKTETLMASQLLARKDVRDLRISKDPAYGKSMTYKAIPLLSLLGKSAELGFDTLQAAATDGYVSELPMALIKKGAKGGAVAWIAIESPKKAWAKIPKKDISAGPFYLVWQFPEKSNITPGQWPYALGSLEGVRSPMQRWPQLEVAATYGDGTPERRGMAVYIKHCLACHRLNGGGEADVGPDMIKPMAATEYMTEKGLRALIRDPAAVRTWPERQMSGFAEDVLPDGDLDDLIAYLKAQATASN